MTIIIKNCFYNNMWLISKINNINLNRIFLWKGDKGYKISKYTGLIKNNTQLVKNLIQFIKKIKWFNDKYYNTE